MPCLLTRFYCPQFTISTIECLRKSFIQLHNHFTPRAKWLLYTYQPLVNASYGKWIHYNSKVVPKCLCIWICIKTTRHWSKFDHDSTRAEPDQLGAYRCHDEQALPLSHLGPHYYSAIIVNSSPILEAEESFELEV